MEIVQKYHNRSCKLSVEGNPGPTEAARLGMMLGNLTARGYKNIVLDLRRADPQTDGAALAHMLENSIRINRNGARLVLCGAPDRLLFRLRLRRVRGFLATRDEGEALAAIGEDALELADRGHALLRAV